MIRTAVHHTLSAAVALALVSTFAAPASSDGEFQNTERELVDSLQTTHRTLDKPTFGENSGAAKKAPRATTSIISGFNSVNR
jgi:hypothetical protein